MTKLNVLCIGLGNQFVNYHILSILNFQLDINDLCLVDTNKSRCIIAIEALKEKNFMLCERIRYYESPEDAFGIFDSNNNLSYTKLCIISTPLKYHYQLIEQALANNFHVYVDKPFVSDAKEGLNIIEKSKMYNKAVVIGSQRRFESIYNKIYDTATRIGKLVDVSFENHGQFKNYDINSLENDIFVGVGYHIIDTVVWIIEKLRGDIVSYKINNSIIQKWHENSNFHGAFHTVLILKTSNEDIPVRISVSNMAPRDTIFEIFSITGMLGNIRLYRNAMPRNPNPGLVKYSYWDENIKCITDKILNKDDVYDRTLPLKQLFDYILYKKREETLESTPIKSINTLRIIDSIKEESTIII
jgi:predicted dehydrogenase